VVRNDNAAEPHLRAAAGPAQSLLPDEGQRHLAWRWAVESPRRRLVHFIWIIAHVNFRKTNVTNPCYLSPTQFVTNIFVESPYRAYAWYVSSVHVSDERQNKYKHTVYGSSPVQYTARRLNDSTAHG
jgi:hypothetical protein